MQVDTHFDLSRPLTRPLASTPKRVALFTGAYNHIADGVSLTLNRLVAHLEQQGVAVRVFAPTVDDPPVDHAGSLTPVPSFAAPGRSEYRVALPFTPAMRRELADFQPTLFHIATPDLLGFRALRLAKSWNVPVVASYHTHFSSYLKYYNLDVLEDFLWKYLRWFYDQCEHIYVPSHSMVSVLRSHDITGGLHLWQRGVDTSRFTPANRSLSWRHTLGIEDDEVLVTFVSRLVWEKGLGLLADVVETLRERDVPFRSMIVGDGPAREELEARLPDTIFTGYLEGEALTRAYASSDVFLFPSETETFGNVTLEAMASGLPTVCADATGSASLVENGETGFLAEPGKLSSFLHHVERLLTDDALRHEMGYRALERAQEYEWSTILGRIVQYYDEVLNPHLISSGDGAGDGLSRTAPELVAQPVSE
jgi:glycosyltransferase involved in cell wall biosynthesis